MSSIVSNSFAGCSSLKTVTILEGLTTIGNDAFNNCSSLESVTLPNSITSIGQFGNFFGHPTIVYNEYENGLYLGNSDNPYLYLCAIRNSSINSFTFHYNCKLNNNDAFHNCSSLESVTLPDSLISIASNTFESCHLLKSITIPSSVTTIGEYAFYNCSSLESVIIPNSVTRIINNLFTENCSTCVFFAGTKEEYGAIDGFINFSQKVYYYSDTDKGNEYWHYVNSVPTIW